MARAKMTAHDEIWQLYSTDGQPIPGKGVPSDTKHAEEYSFGLALVWLWRLNDGVLEICLQKRALSKKRYPGMYSTSAGGHVNLDETPQVAAVRECEEELGVMLDPEKLRFIGTFRVNNEPQNIRFIFSYHITEDVVFRFNDGEVETVEWMSHDELMKRVNTPDGNMVFRLYGAEYVEVMMKHIVREAREAVR